MAWGTAQGGLRGFGGCYVMEKNSRKDSENHLSDRKQKRPGWWIFRLAGVDWGVSGEFAPPMGGQRRD